MKDNWWDSFNSKDAKTDETSMLSKAIPHTLTGLIVVLLNAALAYLMSSGFADNALNHSQQNTNKIENVKTAQTEHIEDQKKNEERISILEETLEDLKSKLKQFEEKAPKVEEKAPKVEEKVPKITIFPPE